MTTGNACSVGVCSLMQIEQKQWDEEVLLDICNERDKNLIKKIPLSKREDHDAWFWFPDEKGCFTVKSCYRLLQGEVDAPYAKCVQVDTTCQWCRQDQETDVHVLFGCEIEIATWVAVDLQTSISILREDNVFDIIRRAFDRCNMEQCTLVVLICWSIWTRINKWVWEKINMSVFGIKAAALNILTEWKQAHEQKMTSGTGGAAPLAVRKWERPQD
ncbi:uncharacterized protein LOC141691612 [Apium graveolens]|uniref:uncharacterized protein LOC141691612 n=1 Tax=Apium graveolens TaxID=4045 RepID=UPI003D7C0CE7